MTSHLELVKEVAQAISATWDAHGACAVSLEVLCDHFGFPGAVLWTPDADGTFVASHVHAPSAARREELARHFRDASCRVGDGVLGSLLTVQASSATWAVDAADDDVSRTLSALGYAASTAFAVHARGSCAAVLHIPLRERRRPDPDVLAVIETVAIQLGHVVERVEAREELSGRDRNTRRILDSSADAFASIDTRGRIVDWNRTAEELFGWSADEILGQKLTDTITSPEAVRRHWDDFQALFATGRSTIARQPLEVTLQRRDGSEFLAEAVIWETDVDQGERLVSAFIRDVSELRRRERQLAANREQLAHAQRLAKVGSWNWDAVRGELNWSEQYLVNLGLPPDTEPSLELLLSRVHPDDRERLLNVLDEAHASGDDFSLEYRIITPDGELRRMRAIGQVETRDGQLIRTWGAVQDITEEHELRELIRHRARHDALTDLANRPAFQEAVQEGLDEIPGDGRVVVALLDLDRFSEVNDQLGTGGGDAAILAVAERLREAVGPGWTPARLGGDEFGVMTVLEEPSPEALESVATRLHDLMAVPFDVDGRRWRITASIGIATDGQSGHDADDLLRDADVALNMAKARGGDVYQLFESAMHEEALAQLALRADIQRAVAEGHMEVHYQPVVSLRTGEAVGFEALARWERPGHERVSPGLFIPVIEELGLVGALGRHVLRQACQDLVEFRQVRQGTRDLTVAVNLSAHQLDDPDLLDAVREALDEAGLPPSALVLEVTESTIAADDSRAVSRLWELERLGVRIAIDDFGTGYSSLGRLRDYPAHLLKIDRSFLKDIRSPEDEPAILGALFAMARTLGLVVVSEGVETAAQLAVVIRHGGDEVQGFLFGPALPSAHVRRLLVDPSWDLDSTDRASEAPADDTDSGPGEEAPILAAHEHLATALAGLAEEPTPERFDQVLTDVSEVTGLASTYLTRIDLRGQEQQVVRAVNRGPIQVTAGSAVDWAHSLCRRALADDTRHVEHAAGTYPDTAAAELGIDGYISVPVYAPDGSLFGTLCGVYPEDAEIRDGTVDLLELVGRSVGPYLHRLG